MKFQYRIRRRKPWDQELTWTEWADIKNTALISVNDSDAVEFRETPVYCKHKGPFDLDYDSVFCELKTHDAMTHHEYNLETPGEDYALTWV